MGFPTESVNGSSPPGLEPLTGVDHSEQRTQHVLHDSAVPVVVGFAGRVDAYGRVELDLVGPYVHGLRRSATVERLDTGDRESLFAGEPERAGALPGGELQRQYAHADQVRPVYALVGLGD